MPSAHEIIRDYFTRTSAPPDSTLDAVYKYEVTMLRETLTRLEVILGDEGVPQETIERVIRCMLYGSPSPAAAEERMRRDTEMAQLLERLPPLPADLLLPDVGPRG